MQLGFVIDQTRCIGCHACTVACKAENDVPVGDFRTWVKYTEVGEFPKVKRSFTVLRCNQCSDAPCMSICPTNALHKRSDGIVDIDPSACIGCKSCLQACPYDALYIDDRKGIAQKCHFCAHRTEQGLAPACAVVCPTEAIIPGDFHDPESRVSHLANTEGLQARKLEAGTGPNVWYKSAANEGLDPSLTNTSGGFLWSDQMAGSTLDAQTFEALNDPVEGRTVYDVHHPPMWGLKIILYMFTKSIAAGLAMLGVLMQPNFGLVPDLDRTATMGIPILALIFLGLTTGFLISDLKRPERFLYILLRPNWSSWLAKGGIILIAFGALISIWLGLIIMEVQLPKMIYAMLHTLTFVAGLLAAMYTAWLFQQAKGRVLWLRRSLPTELAIHALLAGSCFLILLAPAFDFPNEARQLLKYIFGSSLIAHGILMVLETKMGPPNREPEYRRAVRLISHGPFRDRHWWIGVGLGVIIPLAIILVSTDTSLYVVAGALALVGLYSEEDILVRAGQALPIS